MKPEADSKKRKAPEDGGNILDTYKGMSTRAVQAGECCGRPKTSDAMATPIVQTATFTFKNTQEVIDFNEGRLQSFEYGRYGNPTSKVLEQKLAALDGAEDCLVSTSGMNSCTTMLLALVPKDGHIVTTKDCYRRTRQFMQTFLPKMGIQVTVLDPSDYDGLHRVVSAASPPVDLYFSESPTNPYLRCVDVARVATICDGTLAKGHKTIVVIDTTFATPVNMRPLEIGADLVLTSGTKYLAGHNDVLFGALAGSTELIKKVRQMHAVLGGVIDPHAAWLALRGLKTLPLRVERQNANALLIAKFLEGHPKIDVVHYPGLPSHSDHDVAKKQMSGFGGVVSFEVKGGLSGASSFIDLLRIPYIAPSLGGVDSLVEQPTVISYWDRTAEERAEIGIRDGLIRFSCGIEDGEDLLADVTQALEKCTV